MHEQFVTLSQWAPWNGTNVTLYRNRNTQKMHAQSFCWQRFCVFSMFCMCTRLCSLNQPASLYLALFVLHFVYFSNIFFSSQILCVRTTQSLTLIIYASLTLFCFSRKSLLWWCLLLFQFNVRNREKSHCGRSDKKSKWISPFEIDKMTYAFVFWFLLLLQIDIIKLK